MQIDTRLSPSFSIYFWSGRGESLGTRLEKGIIKVSGQLECPVYRENLISVIVTFVAFLFGTPIYYFLTQLQNMFALKLTLLMILFELTSIIMVYDKMLG